MNDLASSINFRARLFEGDRNKSCLKVVRINLLIHTVKVVSAMRYKKKMTNFSIDSTS